MSSGVLQRSLFALTLFISLVSPSFAVTPYVSMLNDVLVKEGEDAFFQKVLKFESFERVNTDSQAVQEIREILDMLQNFTLGYRGSRYDYVYARYLYKANIKDTATLMYLSALMKVAWDGARCVDKTATPTARGIYITQMGPFIEKYLRSISGEDRAEIFRKFHRMAEAHRVLLTRRKQPEEWPCRNGASYYTKYFEKHIKRSDETFDELKNNSMGFLALPPDSSIRLSFVSNKEWVTERETAVNKFMESVKQFQVSFEKQPSQ